MMGKGYCGKRTNGANLRERYIFHLPIETSLTQNNEMCADTGIAWQYLHWASVCVESHQISTVCI